LLINDVCAFSTTQVKDRLTARLRLQQRNAIAGLVAHSLISDSKPAGSSTGGYKIEMSDELLSIYSPELLWQGGADNGKPEPVFGVDMNPSNVLATAGNDENVPPKGSVRLWRIAQDKDGQEFIIEFNDHQSVVNTVRFSPCGKMIASASDKQIVVYKVQSAEDWQTLSDMRSVERIWLRPSLDEIFDIKWSPDSNFLIAGALDNKAEILRVSTRDSVLIPGHTNYVQGVAWDPLNCMVVTQSADRTFKMHQIKFKAGAMVKLAPKGHVVAKMLVHDKEENKDAPLTAADFGMAEGGGAVATASNKKQQNLYADYTVQSYFRRPDFTPDGTLLISPTGVFKPSSVAGAADASAAGGATSFCTHVFWRDHLQSPILSLTGLEDPSVAVRCCPVLFKLVRTEGEAVPDCMVAGNYR
jgi:chromatin assembly factor 1 subunit B